MPYTRAAEYRQLCAEYRELSERFSELDKPPRDYAELSRLSRLIRAVSEAKRALEDAAHA